jgi:hypothetical protein
VHCTDINVQSSHVNYYYIPKAEIKEKMQPKREDKKSKKGEAKAETYIPSSSLGPY